MEVLPSLAPVDVFSLALGECFTNHLARFKLHHLSIFYECLLFFVCSFLIHVSKNTPKTHRSCDSCVKRRVVLLYAAGVVVWEKESIYVCAEMGVLTKHGPPSNSLCPSAVQQQTQKKNTKTTRRGASFVF